MNTPKRLSLLAVCTISVLGCACLTSARAGTFDANFNDNLVPPGSALYGDLGDGNAGIVEDGVVKLTKAVVNQNGGFVIEDLDGGTPISGFTATFKMLIGGGSGAEGLSFNFGPDLPSWTFGQEGAGTGLSICFDSYLQTGEVAPAIDLKNGRTIVGSVTGILPVFRQGKFVNVWVQVKSDGTLSLTVDNTVIFTNFYGAFTSSEGRFGFGASSGGSLGDNHWLDDVHIETITTPVVQPAHPLVLTNTPTGAGLPAQPPIHIEIKDFTTQVNTNTVKLLYNGVQVAATVAKTDDITTVDYLSPTAPPPLSANTYTVIFDDNGTPPYTTTVPYTFTTANYRSAFLPVPLYLETFDSTDEGSIPAGWSQTNATTIQNDWFDLTDPASDSFLGWTVLDRSRFNASNVPFDTRRLNVAIGYLNGVLITNLIDGRCAYAASDRRSGSGNQIQMLFSPDFDLRGKTNVFLAFNSIYTQNQDSLGAVEYSINQGASWLPILYMLDASGTSPGGYDIVTNTLGQVDGQATFTQARTDTPKVDDGAGGTRYTTWSEFVQARPLSSLGPYVSGRWNDDQVESKRIEVFRLPQADNQATVRVRFVQVGTGSWYFGIDNFGLYSISSPKLTIARTGNNVTVSWPADEVGFTLQKAATLTSPQWTAVAGAVNNSVTLPIGTSPQFYRLVK